MTNFCLSRCRAAVITAVMLALTLTSTGCSLSDAGLTAYRPSDQYFAVLALEHHAINLSTTAPYDTLTLHTIRTMGDGSVVPGEVTYSVNNPAISVTNGVLKAHSAINSAVLRVTLTYGTMTRTDSALVSVIGTAPDRLRAFGLRVPAGDSAKSAANVPKTLPLIRESESGANLSTLLVSLLSSDTMAVTITREGNSEVSITPRQPGRFVLSASTFAYGAVWRDSLVFTVGWPIRFGAPIVEKFTTGSISTELDFVYRNFTIGVGGCVVWTNESRVSGMDVQFDDPSHVGPPAGSVCTGGLANPEVGGNIASFRLIPMPEKFLQEGFWDTATDEDFQEYLQAAFSPRRARAFLTAGVFPYRSTLHGVTGIIRVCDERNDTTCAPTRIGSWY